MAKNEEKVESKETPSVERPIQLIFVSDGVYKYIYTDTGEDC